jgi:N-acetylmuramoyl-L-alanine amidase
MTIMKKTKCMVAAILVAVLMAALAAPVFAAVTHTVAKGESLYLISQRYGTTIAALKRDNGLSQDTIYPQQTLRINTNITATPSRSGGFGLSTDDISWLAKCVYGEARGESYTGQVAVAAVILNRVEHPSFPKTVKGVIFEPLAFTAVADGQIYLTPNTTAVQAARDAAGGWDPSGGALYYWNPAKATSKWIWTRTIIKKIGNHVFGL